jgi:putative nucleotidyltransferase with HDIG domain
MDIIDRVSQKICADGIPVFMVGGCVRDFFRGVDPCDVDLVTPASPEQIVTALSSLSGIKFDLVGSSFGVIMVKDLHNQETVEIATYREDISTGPKHSDFNVNFIDNIEGDLARRDLTINALAQCVVTGDIVDPHGGFEDIRNKVIKFVGVPDDRIIEDPLRMLRAGRFLSLLDGYIDRESFNAIKRNAKLVKTIPGERIRAEILKSVKTAKYASRFFYLMAETGILEYILPSLAECFEFPHGHHHLEDVFDHSMIVGDAISVKYPLVKLAGYLHDIGKPAAYIKNGGLNFFQHDKIGAKLLKDELTDLRFSVDEITFIVGLVRHHMGLSNDASPKAIRRKLQNLDQDRISFRDFLRLRIADRYGNLKKTPFTGTYVKDFVRLFIENRKAPTKTSELSVNGHDIMAHLDIGPGPIVGNILGHLLDVVIENPEYNVKEVLLQLSENKLLNQNKIVV